MRCKYRSLPQPSNDAIAHPRIREASWIQHGFQPAFYQGNVVALVWVVPCVVIIGIQLNAVSRTAGKPDIQPRFSFLCGICVECHDDTVRTAVTALYAPGIVVHLKYKIIGNGLAVPD